MTDQPLTDEQVIANKAVAIYTEIGLRVAGVILKKVENVVPPEIPKQERLRFLAAALGTAAGILLVRGMVADFIPDGLTVQDANEGRQEIDASVFQCGAFADQLRNEANSIVHLIPLGMIASALCMGMAGEAMRNPAMQYPTVS